MRTPRAELIGFQPKEGFRNEAVDLHFPPSALQNVKKGDRVAVELAMKPMGSASKNGGAPAASPKTDKSPKTNGKREKKS